MEKRVQTIKVERGVSFIEARRIATAEQRVESGARTQPLAAVVQAGGGQQRPTTRSTCTQANLTWPDNQETPTLIYTSTSASSQTYERTSPQAATSSGAEGQSPSNPSRPPRKNQRSSPPMTTQPRKRQPSTHDRPLGARPKIKRLPKGESVDLQPSSNRFHALQGDVEGRSVSDSDECDMSHFS